MAANKIRWATASDFATMESGSRDTRRALTLLIDGQPAAMLTVRFARRGMPAIVTADISDKARAHPKALHAFARQGLAVVTDLGTRSLLAVADRSIPRSGAWLERLGFQAVAEIDEGTIYRWQRQQSQAQSKLPGPSTAEFRKAG